MSEAIAMQLAELARDRGARRRRAGEIQREVQLALARVQGLRFPPAGARSRSVQGARRDVGGQTEDQVRKGATDEMRERPRGDVVDQVRDLLKDVDVAHREAWTSDDARILHYFEEAWEAAAQKGYTFEELVLILRTLAPCDQESEEPQ